MKHKLITLLLSLAVVSGCSRGKDVHLIWIGLDSWGSYSVAKADMPTVKKMMADGAYTLKKRSVLPSSSAVNWASMFMGACPELNGYTEWDSKIPEIPSAMLTKDGIFPTIFEVYRESNPKAEMGCICEWDGIKYVIDSLAFNKVYVNTDTIGINAKTCQATVNYIKSSKPDICLTVFDEPDHTGHHKGHGTVAYYKKIHELDKYIARIVQATKDAGIYDDCIFIITADHGGIHHGHGGKTMAELETPFIVYGKGIKKVGNTKSIMMEYDIAPTVADLLGVKMPEICNGKSIIKKL